MRVKVSELSGVGLDWAVMSLVKGEKQKYEIEEGKLFLLIDTRVGEAYQPFMPSRRWADGGPLIERFELSICKEWHLDKYYACSSFETGSCDRKENCIFGPTALVAAMRCLLLAIAGDEIDLPEGLV